MIKSDTVLSGMPTCTTAALRTLLQKIREVSPGALRGIDINRLEIPRGGFEYLLLPLSTKKGYVSIAFSRSLRGWDFSILVPWQQMLADLTSYNSV